MDADRLRLIGKELQLSLSSTGRSLYFHGKSMHPFLQEGDLVMVRPVDWDDLALGDVITYRNEDKFPTRRILAKRGDRLKLCCDGWVDRRFHARRDDILGRAEARLRAGRWISRSDAEWRIAAVRSIANVSLRSLGRRLSGLLRRRK